MILRKSRVAIVSMVIAIALTGCGGYLPVKDTQYVSIPVAELAPTQDMLQSSGAKIILSPIEYSDKNDRVFVDSVYDDLSQRLLKSGNVLVDRKLANKLKNELLAAEQSGRFQTSGPAVADIAMMTKIVSLSYSSTYHKRKKKKDSKGNTYYRDAYCSFRSKAKLNVRAYKIPSMELVNTYEYEGSYKKSIDMRNSRCSISGHTTYNILNAALAKAIKSDSHRTLNDIAPESYVLERYDDKSNLGEKVLYRTTIGTRQGAVEGAEVNIYHKVKRKNPLTKTTRIENILIGEGEITSEIDETGSYVYVDDEALISSIKIGDVVKLNRGKCGFDEYQVFGVCIK